MKNPVRAYVGLGSNLENPRGQIESAFAALQALSAQGKIRKSSLYISPPMGPPAQPDYINAAVGLDTRMSPEQLLQELQVIEQRQGRVRGGLRWGPRTLDLDLLLFGDLRLDTERLQIPHPGLHERAFVLYPLAELAPDLIVPDLGSLQSLLQECPMGDLERLT